jgi:hypothetical protein
MYFSERIEEILNYIDFQFVGSALEGEGKMEILLEKPARIMIEF